MSSQSPSIGSKGARARVSCRVWGRVPRAVAWCECARELRWGAWLRCAAYHRPDAPHDVSHWPRVRSGSRFGADSSTDRNARARTVPCSPIRACTRRVCAVRWQGCSPLAARRILLYTRSAWTWAMRHYFFEVTNNVCEAYRMAIAVQIARLGYKRPGRGVLFWPRCF